MIRCTRMQLIWCLCRLVDFLAPFEDKSVNFIGLIAKIIFWRGTCRKHCWNAAPHPRTVYFANQVYADRYLELLDSPAELSVANTAPGFSISVQMTSSDVGPYACLIFHDPVATPLTVGELQQQFNGPYSDFTTAQVIWSSALAILSARPVSD